MTENNTTVTNQELVSKAFYYLNSYKRHRALEQINRLDGKRDIANFHQLKQYQFIDSLELALRAIQKGTRVEELAEEGE